MGDDLEDPFREARTREQRHQEWERLPRRLAWGWSRVGSLVQSVLAVAAGFALLVAIAWIFLGWTSLFSAEARLWMSTWGGGLILLPLLAVGAARAVFPHHSPKEIETVRQAWAEEDAADDVRWAARIDGAGGLSPPASSDQAGAVSRPLAERGGLSADGRPGDG